MKFLARDRLQSAPVREGGASAAVPHHAHLQFSRLGSRFLANLIISFSASLTERGMRKGPRFPSNQSITATDTSWRNRGGSSEINSRSAHLRYLESNFLSSCPPNIEWLRSPIW